MVSGHLGVDLWNASKVTFKNLSEVRCPERYELVSASQSISNCVSQPVSCGLVDCPSVLRAEGGGGSGGGGGAALT